MMEKAKVLLAQALDCHSDDILDTSALGLHPKWDSMAHLRLLLTLEEEYNVTITDESIEQLSTVIGIHAAISNLEG